jgi:xylulokinase
MRRLPRLLAKDEIVGQVSPYLANRFGFKSDTMVVVGSGDNPCSLVGLGLMGVADIHAISLGTSDTYFGYMIDLEDRENMEGHIFGTAVAGSWLLCALRTEAWQGRLSRIGMG